ncbi:MAG: hypothetical protein ACR2QL_11245 [Woeseiaceae bacterium]
MTFASHSLAQGGVEQDEILTEEEQQAIAEDSDGSLDDAESSIEVDLDELQEGIKIDTDLRIGYFENEVDERLDGSSNDDTIDARWHLRLQSNIASNLRVVGRIAGLCSNDECSPNLVLEDSIPFRNGMSNGDITLDEAYLHLFRIERFDLAAGRMQTRFVARGGIFTKSLDRNDSNNVNVNWTDGLHATFRTRNGWVPHLILQHNSSDGPTNIRWDPLDFSDSSARVTYFFGIESLERTPYFLQRGLDISYLPKSLLKDGELSGRREDYYGVVLRSANRWPERDDGIRLRVASEIGYATETQIRSAAGLAGNGDTDGLAWNIALSLMEFQPDHSIGINYGEVGAGWLLSPQYRPNESLAEIRYQWRRSQQLALDFRIRKRKDLERLQFTDRKREEVDFFLRFTWGKTLN